MQNLDFYEITLFKNNFIKEKTFKLEIKASLALIHFCYMYLKKSRFKNKIISYMDSYVSSKRKHLCQ